MILKKNLCRIKFICTNVKHKCSYFIKGNENKCKHYENGLCNSKVAQVNMLAIELKNRGINVAV